MHKKDGRLESVIPPDPTLNGWEAVVVLVLDLALAVTVYLIPWIIASARGIPTKRAIGLVNLLLGWTVAGWLVALWMVNRRPPASRKRGETFEAIFAPWRIRRRVLKTLAEGRTPSPR